jgi:hypothetical protein
MSTPTSTSGGFEKAGSEPHLFGIGIFSSTCGRTTGICPRPSKNFARRCCVAEINS